MIAKALETEAAEMFVAFTSARLGQMR